MTLPHLVERRERFASAPNIRVRQEQRSEGLGRLLRKFLPGWIQRYGERQRRPGSGGERPEAPSLTGPGSASPQPRTSIQDSTMAGTVYSCPTRTPSGTTGVVFPQRLHRYRRSQQRVCTRMIRPSDWAWGTMMGLLLTPWPWSTTCPCPCSRAKAPHAGHEHGRAVSTGGASCEGSLPGSSTIARAASKKSTITSVSMVLRW